MKNWIQRLAIFAVVGAVLSSAALVGCGGGEPADAEATPTAAADGGTE